MGDKKVVRAQFNEATRACHNDKCGKKLSGMNGMIYIIVPGSGAYEYCSWGCAYSHLKALLKTKVAEKKELGDDRLLALGYTRQWDGVTPLDISEDLNKPIDGD